MAGWQICILEDIVSVKNSLTICLFWLLWFFKYSLENMTQKWIQLRLGCRRCSSYKLWVFVWWLLLWNVHCSRGFKVQVRSSPASRASLWPAARLVDPLEDRPVLYLAGHSLSDRMRTPVPVGRNTARERESQDSAEEKLFWDTEEHFQS